MIRKKTVLVLGAGASQPYGYPTGKQLRSNIISNCSVLTNPGALGKQLANMGYSNDQIWNFCREFHRTTNKSIDAFLERRPEFMELGKVAIAQELIRCESEYTLFNPNEWYSHLLNKLEIDSEDFVPNMLSVVSFNYDRSLECCLFNRLKGSLGISDSECAEKLKGSLSSMYMAH